MYHCGICGVQSVAGERGREVVLERRMRTYPRRGKANRVVTLERGKDKPKRKASWVDDPGGVGWETVRAVRACPACAGSATPT